MSGRQDEEGETGLLEPAQDGETAAGKARPEFAGDRLFVFDYAERAFAVPLIDVERIIEPVPVEHYPGEARHCKGTIEHLGRVVPLFDPHGLCFGSDREAPVSNILILNRDGVRFALILSRYRQLLDSCSLACDVTTEDSAADSPARFSIGLMRHGETTVALLSPAVLARTVREIFGSQPLLREGKDDAGAPEEQGGRFMVSRLGDMSIAHPLEETLEIVEGLDVTPVFGVDPCLRGLVNLRGQVFACLDISEALGLAPRALDERSIFVVLSAEGADFALCVDAVDGLRRLPSALVPVEGVLPREVGAIVTGLVEHDGRTLLLLSPAAIVEWERLAPFTANSADGRRN
jgi:purine-binding chemotaxis protein CheW